MAIANRRDRNYQDAIQIFRRLLESSMLLITTTWTTYEALSIVKSRLGFSQAERLWERINSRAVVDVVRIEEQTEQAALGLLWRYKDKKWGVVDCVSLVVMQSPGCRHAFAYDGHFVEAGRQFGFSVVE